MCLFTFHFQCLLLYLLTPVKVLYPNPRKRVPFVSLANKLVCLHGFNTFLPEPTFPDLHIANTYLPVCQALPDLTVSRGRLGLVDASKMSVWTSWSLQYSFFFSFFFSHRIRFYQDLWVTIPYLNLFRANRLIQTVDDSGQTLVWING